MEIIYSIYSTLLHQGFAYDDLQSGHRFYDSPKLEDLHV